MTDTRLRTVLKLCVYGWVSVFNMVVIGMLWFVSPLGYSPVVSSIRLPSSRPDIRYSASTVSGEPVHISIDSIDIDLDVLQGRYHESSQTWDISQDSAQFATISSLANTATGNTLIYGHNNKQVFYTLRTIKPGARAHVTTNNGYRFTYQFTNMRNVPPTDLSVFRYDGAPTLTIQTCTGSWNETRGLFLFQLKGVEKA